MALYKNAKGIEHDVYVIHAVEERDHHTMSLAIDRPVAENKHIISRDAYLSHKPRVKDYLAFDASGSIYIVKKGDNETLGLPVNSLPSLATPIAEKPVTEGLNVTSGISSIDGSSTAKIDDSQSAPPSDEVIESKPVMSLSRLSQTLLPPQDE